MPENQARTSAFTPLAREGQAIGVMIVSRREVRPFRPDELELMQGFADQAVIAIENARLLTELRESLERQTATSEVLGVISSSPGELQPVFDTMVDNAVRLCEAAEGTLFRLSGRTMHRVASSGLSADLLAQTDMPVAPGSPPERALETKSTVHIADLAEEMDQLERANPGHCSLPWAASPHAPARVP